MHIDLSLSSGAGGLADNAVFVMYNCARLATLFQHFNEAVSRGLLTKLLMWSVHLSVDWSNCHWTLNFSQSTVMSWWKWTYWICTKRLGLTLRVMLTVTGDQSDRLNVVVDIW